MLTIFSNMSPAVRLALAVFSLLLLSACSPSGKPDLSGKAYEMGAPVSAGQLTYTVIDSEWQESLDGERGTRLPKHRFMLLNISVTNNGGSEAGVPLLTVYDAQGNEYREDDNGAGVPQWLGVLRFIGAGQTVSGRILFDVPPGGYKLRVSNGGDPDKEDGALVEIPYRVEPAPIKGVNPLGAPPAAPPPK